MPRKPRNEVFYQLKKPKIRASWNVKNLYNIYRQRDQHTAGSQTFFQQKFEAKSLTRGYHGEWVKEKKWQRLFSRHIPAVVELRAKELGQQDGAVQSAGRGAGLDEASRFKEKEREKERSNNLTPYMAHTYWVLERRLDVAIFRALFASSARQARQLVIHGHVKVNGKKMVHPSYLLNPGDMFSVEPERVLVSTGKYINDEKWQKRVEWLEKKAAREEEQGGEAGSKTAATHDTASKDDVDTTATTAPTPDLNEQEPIPDEEDDSDLTPNFEPDDSEDLKARKTLILQLQELTRDAEKDHAVSAKQKRALRSIRAALRHLQSRAKLITPNEIEAVAGDLQALITEIERRDAAGKSREPEMQKPGERKGGQRKLSEEDREIGPHMLRLGEIAEKQMERWSPKDFMAPFAFVPRYLEVNYTVCSAVYLRHPAVRNGSSEIPSPFSLDTGSLAFAWYLRRR